MNAVTVTAAALPMGGYASFAEKRAAAMDLIELAAKDGANLIVFPELLNSLDGTTPPPHRLFTEASLLSPDHPDSIAPLTACAAAHQMAVVIPVALAENGHLWNTALVFDDLGQRLARYDKVYPTIPELDSGIAAGAGPVVAEWRGTRIGFMICFDLNYPQLAAAYHAAGVRMLCVPTMFTGGRLLNSYAFLHGLYAVSAYAEWSRFVNPFGKDIGGAGARMESWRSGILPPIVTRTLNLDFARLHLAFNQDQFRAIKAHFGPRVSIEIDQGSALAVIESREPGLSVESILEAYGLEPMDAYLARSAAHRDQEILGRLS